MTTGASESLKNDVLDPGEKWQHLSANGRLKNIPKY